jgi:integrase/recombinase XerD
MPSDNEKANDIAQLARVRAMFAGQWRTAAAVGGSETPERPLDDEEESPDVAPTEVGDATLALMAPRETSLGRPMAAQPYDLYLATRRSVRTQQTMRESLERAARLLPGGPYPGSLVPWERLRAEHTGAIYAELNRRDYSPWTIKITLAAVKGVLHQAWKLALIDRETFARATTWDKVETDSRRGARGREIPQAELEKLAVYCRSLGPAHRDWPASAYGAMLEALFALMVGGGIRASEVCRVPLGGASGGKPLGYIPSEGRVRYLAKGNKERTIKLKPAERKALDAWLGVRAELEPEASTLLVRVLPDGRLGEPQTMNRRVVGYLCATVANEAGVTRFAPHDCRRTFGTRGWRQTGDGPLVQRLMGHKNLSTTAIYDMRGKEEDERARVERIDMWPEEKS